MEDNYSFKSSAIHIYIYICRGARLEGSQVLPAENSPGAGGLSWHQARFAGSCPLRSCAIGLQSTLPFSCPQLVYVKKLSPGFGTGWACPENQWSVTASILQPSSAPPKVFHLFGCVFCMAPMVYCLSGSKMGIYYLPDPCKVEKFGYSPYYAWGIKAVLCFCRLWNLCLNSKSQMAWAMSVWPGGAGAQVRAGPALCLGFLFWRCTLIFQMRIKVIAIRQAVPRVLWLWPRVTRQCKYSRDLKARAITAIRCP